MVHRFNFKCSLYVFEIICLWLDKKARVNQLFYCLSTLPAKRPKVM